jgi:hypothetical protein
MSSYKGQRGPNVSQYIATLNQPSPQQDLLADPAPAEDFSDFLNADFFDVSNARNASVDFSTPGDFDINFGNEPSQPLKTTEGFQPVTTASMDFNLNGKRLVIVHILIFCRNGLGLVRNARCSRSIVSAIHRPMAG